MGMATGESRSQKGNDLFFLYGTLHIAQSSGWHLRMLAAE